MSENKFEFHFHAPVGQNIANVEHMDVHIDKDGQIQVMNAEQFTTSHEDQAQANGTEGYFELTDGTMEQHLQFFKEAMLKAQDIVYKSEHTKLVANTYDWVAAERLGKDIGLLKNYDELADILKDDNFREVPKNSQNLTPYRTIIAENTKYPNWQCYKPNEDGKFRKFKQFADAIYSLYKLNCEKNHIKPFGNM